MKPRRVAVVTLVLATVAITAAYGLAFLPGGAPAGTVLLMTLGIAAMAISLMTLGAVREGERLGILGYAFSFLFVVFLVGFGAAFLLPANDTADMSLWLGLPPRAAVIMYGIGVLPVLVLPFVYARTFESRTLRPGDIERVRSAAAEHRRQMGAGKSVAMESENGGEAAGERHMS